MGQIRTDRKAERLEAVLSPAPRTPAAASYSDHGPNTKMTETDS